MTKINEYNEKLLEAKSQIDQRLYELNYEFETIYVPHSDVCDSFEYFVKPYQFANISWSLHQDCFIGLVPDIRKADYYLIEGFKPEEVDGDMIKWMVILTIEDFVKSLAPKEIDDNWQGIRENL